MKVGLIIFSGGGGGGGGGEKAEWSSQGTANWIVQKHKPNTLDAFLGACNPSTTSRLVARIEHLRKPASSLYYDQV